jgi:sulfotransferase family protein
MTLPTFVGIGVPRAGTTWLHALLQSHPDVYVPSRRKELNFFDLYYDRGVAWYEKFFPPEPQAGKYRAIGEITPYYFYGTECPARMAALPVGKLILMLRNPIDRAWSWYALMVRDGHFRGSFEAFMTQGRWLVVEQGSYSIYLQNYYRHFAPEQILVLVYESALADVAGTKRRLADFLGVAGDKFPPVAGTEVVNESYVPKAPRIYGLAVRISRVLRRWDADWAVNAAKHCGIQELFGKAGRLQSMPDQTRQRLREAFDGEIEVLESLLGTSLDVWR